MQQGCLNRRLKQREGFPLKKWESFLFHMERPHRKTEQEFGTNVLEIAVCIYTNKMLYGIIKITFVLSGWICELFR